MSLDECEVYFFLSLPSAASPPNAIKPDRINPAVIEITLTIAEMLKTVKPQTKRTNAIIIITISDRLPLKSQISMLKIAMNATNVGIAMYQGSIKCVTDSTESACSSPA